MKKIIGFFWLWCFVLAQSVFAANTCHEGQCKCDLGYCLDWNYGGNPTPSWCKKCTDIYIEQNNVYCAGTGMATPTQGQCKGQTTCPDGKYANSNRDGCVCAGGKYSSGNTCQVCPTGQYREVSFGDTECVQCHMVGYYGTTRSGNDASLHDTKNDCVIKVIFNGNDGAIKNGGSGLINPTVYAEYVPDTYSGMNDSCYFQDRNAIGEPVGTLLPLCVSTAYGFKLIDGVANFQTRWQRAGHTFAGWYKDEAMTQLVKVNDVFPGKEPTDAPIHGNWVTEHGTEVNLYAKWCKTDEHWVAQDGKCICTDGYIQQSSACAKCPAGKYCKKGWTSGQNCPTSTFPHSEEGSDDVHDCYAELTLKIGTETSVVLKVDSWYNSDFGTAEQIASCDIDTSGTPLVTAASDKGCVVHRVGATTATAYYVNPLLAPANIPEHAVFVGWYKDAAMTEKLGHLEDLTGDNTLYTQIVCEQGYYKNLATGDCTVCPSGTTTATVGATSSDECKTAFRYGEGKFWTWPSGMLVLPSP